MKYFLCYLPPMDPEYHQQSNYFDVSANRFAQNLLSELSPAHELELGALADYLSLPPGSTLIDFGCGSGRVSLYFLERGYHVIGVDVSRKSLNDLEKYYRTHKNPSWGRFESRLTLPSAAKVRAIAGADVLHHVNISRYLPLFHRLLVPGGKIAFSEPNSYHFPWYIHYFTNHIPWSIEKGIMQCSLFNFRRLLRKAGFDSFTVRGHGLLPTPLFNSFPNLCRVNAMRWGNFPLLRLFAFRYLVLAQKH